MIKYDIKSTTQAKDKYPEYRIRTKGLQKKPQVSAMKGFNRDRDQVVQTGTSSGYSSIHSMHSKHFYHVQALRCTAVCKK